MPEEQEKIPLGERTIFITTAEGVVPLKVRRTADGYDWMSTRMSHIYMRTTPYMRDQKIKEWEGQQRLKREKLDKGKTLYIRTIDLDAMMEEIHSVRQQSTQ